MHKNILLLFCMAISLHFPAVFAEDRHDLEIAVLDSKKLLLKTKITDKAEIALHKKYATQKQELDKKRDALVRNIKVYNRSTDKFKLQQLEEWQSQIDEQQEELLKDSSELKQEIFDSTGLEIREIAQRFAGIVGKIAKNKKLDLVLFKDVTVYSGKTPDITSQAIKDALKKSKNNE